MSSLENRVVLVTGGARRVGAAICRCLHAAGMRVVLHCRESLEPAERLARELNAERADSARVVQGGFASAQAIEAVAREACQAFGRLDALVNNASAFYPTPVGRIDEQQWEDLLASNLKAPLFLSQALAPELAEREGAIVNLTDIHAVRPLKNYVVYSVAKAGLAMLTASLARELAPRVRVNAVAPGTILWPERDLDPRVQAEILARIPQKREGRPEDLALAVRFFLRDAPYVSGQTLAVDGGRSVVL